MIMLTLERLGYVQKRPDSLHYRLGLRAYGLGQSMMKSLSISELALPHMRVLVDQVRLPAHLAVPDGDQGVYIQKVEAPGMIKIDTYVGRRMDLHCTGVGKIILAFGPVDLLERLLAKPVYIRHTPNTITSPKGLQREVARRCASSDMPSMTKKRNSRSGASRFPFPERAVRRGAFGYWYNDTDTDR